MYKNNWDFATPTWNGRQTDWVIPEYARPDNIWRCLSCDRFFYLETELNEVCVFLLNLSRTLFDRWNSTSPQTKSNLTVYLVKHVPKVAFVSFASGHIHAVSNS